MLILNLMICMLLNPVDDTTGIQADKLWSDHLGHIYTLTDNKLCKYDKNLQKTASYDWQVQGKISNVDVSDPMRIVVFSASANQVLFLDQHLSLLTDPFMLDDLDFYDVSTVCKASRGGFWLFDNIDKQLVHITHLGEVGMKSGTITMYPGFPEIMYEHSGHIYLGFPGQGIIVFDNYAAYEKSLPFAFAKKFECHKNRLIYFREGKIFSYNISTVKENLIADDMEDTKDFTFTGRELFYVSDEQVKQKLLTD
ncbi:MAG: hypothetical protein ACQES1_04260 [Bacteroidota bacterium]